MQLRKSLIVKRHLLHVEEKECLKDCKKGVKMSSMSTVQGQKALKLLLSACHFGNLWKKISTGVQRTSVGSRELKIV